MNSSPSAPIQPPDENAAVIASGLALSRAQPGRRLLTRI
jgi:hypothetical protein